jgi:peptidoglycan/LPS O-acetylase OafA/YrhL
MLLNGTARSAAPKASAAISIALLVLGILRAYIARTAYDLTFAACLMGSVYFLIVHLDAARPIYHAAVRRAIKLCADYSFSLYLVHYSILFFMAPYMGKVNQYALFAAGFLGSNVIALVLAVKTEMRHRELARWLRGRLGVRTAAAVTPKAE